jgi:hypothetical protein
MAVKMEDSVAEEWERRMDYEMAWRKAVYSEL